MNLEPEQLDAKRTAGEQLLVMDVRSHYEFKSGRLPGALHCPFWKVPFHISGLVRGRELEIVLYCEHGPRAILAAKLLNLMGYTKISLLKGHMHRWRREKRKMVKSD